VERVITEHSVSERFACRVLGQYRSTQRKIPKPRDDEAAMIADIIALAIQYGRYGYRRITKMLCAAGWTVSFKRVERIWRREGLKVPARQPKRGRLWLNDGSCIRLRPEYSNHVWSYDFVEDRTHNGRKYRMLNVIDEFTRECIAIRVNRRLRSTDGRMALIDDNAARAFGKAMIRDMVRGDVPQYTGLVMDVAKGTRPFAAFPSRGTNPCRPTWIMLARPASWEGLPKHFRYQRCYPLCLRWPRMAC
jgi:hypothetical protein